MKKVGVVLSALLLGSFVLVTSAQDDNADDPSPRAEEDAGERPPPRPEDDVFIPSEELAADEEVTFPVDI